MATSELTEKQQDSNEIFQILSLPDIPEPRVYSSICAYEKQIFVIGGCDSTGKSLNTTFVYNNDNIWELWPNMPSRRSGATLVLTSKIIYLAGGVDEEQVTLIDIVSLTLDTKSWKSVCKLPVAVVGCGAHSYKNNIYVLGGATTDNLSQSFFGYFDIISQLWVNLPNLPTARYSMSTYCYKDILYVVGGRDVLKPIVEVEGFDLTDLVWKSFFSIPSRRAYSCTFGFENYIYHIGGVSEGVGTWKPNVRKLVERYDIDDNKWVKLKPLKYRRTDFSACMIKDKLLVAGGVSEQNDQLVPISDAERYSSSKDKWESIVSLSIPRCSIACCSYINGMLIIGGMGPGGPQRKAEYITVVS